MIHEWPDQGKRVPKAETTVSAPNKATKKVFSNENSNYTKHRKKSKNIKGNNQNTGNTKFTVFMTFSLITVVMPNKGAYCLIYSEKCWDHNQGHFLHFLVIFFSERF